MCAAFGFLTEPDSPECYGVLDILDDADDIIQDYGLTRSGWRYVYRRVGVLRRYHDESRPQPEG